MQPQPQADDILDIAPPIDVLPYPLWMVVAAAALLLLVLGVLAWLIIRWIKRRPPAPPPTPRTLALRHLEALRPQVEKLEPYAFSVGVSDVLRTYLSAQYGLAATQQTSPEFLATISNLPAFSVEERAMLAAFLERGDLIKFARADATSEDNQKLLGTAIALVQGVRT